MRNLIFSMMLLSAAIVAQPPKPIACDGRVATVRVSDITPGGSVGGFLAAVAAHKAWYASHGLMNDEIYSMPVIVRNETTRAQSYSQQQFVSLHVRGSNQAGGGPKHDESYDAFVKLYRDNSVIKSEYMVCLPNGANK